MESRKKNKYKLQIMRCQRPSNGKNKHLGYILFDWGAKNTNRKWIL